MYFLEYKYSQLSTCIYFVITAFSCDATDNRKSSEIQVKALLMFINAVH